MEDGDGDAQESVVTSVRKIMSKHRVDRLCLWQAIFQNDDGNWKGFYSNGKGCEQHKGTATRWSGCPATHLRFHLLKRGVTNDSALNLIRRSFTPQAFCDALQATFKDGKVVSAAQAEMQDKLEDAKRNAPWVDITQGMELSERLEHELELRGRMQLLDPSHPEALNFNEEQSFKSLGMAGTNASLYTSTQSISLGTTAFEPRDDDKVDSQESSIFGGSDSSKAEDNLEDDTEGVFIENMVAFSLRLSNNPPPPDGHKNSGDAKPYNAESGQDGLVHSPGKVTRMASISSGFSAGVASDHRDIKEMIREWIDGHGSNNIPAQMANLARCAHANINMLINPLPTPQRRGQREKAFSTPTAAEGAREGILTGLRFILTGVWPYQGSSTGLALGK